VIFTKSKTELVPLPPSLNLPIKLTEKDEFFNNGLQALSDLDSATLEPSHLPTAQPALATLASSSDISNFKPNSLLRALLFAFPSIQYTLSLTL
jgi:hypothetical protein